MRFAAIFLIMILLVVGGSYGYVRVKMYQHQTPYTETVEQILMDLVPEEGITVKGRTYSKWNVYDFLEEIRYDPYNYTHKDHHCVLKYVPEEEIPRIIGTLRFILGCK